jgi:hypothetical protein
LLPIFSVGATIFQPLPLVSSLCSEILSSEEEVLQLFLKKYTSSNERLKSSFESQHYDPCPDHKDSKPFSDVWTLPKKAKGEDRNQDKTELVHRSNF